METLTMFTRSRVLALAGLIGAGLLLAPAAITLAQSADPVVEQARSDGTVGEQADGYLGFAKAAAATGDLKARVDQINIKRRAFYTDLAAQRGVTVNEVGAATACELFKNRVNVGHAYRDDKGVWQQRTAAAPVKMPAYCG
jgi:uncharacterized protein